MAEVYEKPTATLINFISMAQLAIGDDERTRSGSSTSPTFEGGTDLESSIFG